MNSKTNIHQERICGALLHFLLLAGLYTAFVYAARSQDASRVVSRVNQPVASSSVNEFPVQR